MKYLSTLLVLLAGLAATGCLSIPQDQARIQEPQATIHIRGATQDLNDYYHRWIFPGKTGLGEYLADGEFAFDYQGRIADAVDSLSGKYSGKTQLGVYRVETEPPGLRSIMVSFSFQCPASMELEDRIKVFADAYHFDCEITPSNSRTADGRKGVIVRLKTR
jgi:hypothetical protein